MIGSIRLNSEGSRTTPHLLAGNHSICSADIACLDRLRLAHGFHCPSDAEDRVVHPHRQPHPHLPRARILQNDEDLISRRTKSSQVLECSSSAITVPKRALLASQACNALQSPHLPDCPDGSTPPNSVRLEQTAVLIGLGSR